MIADDRGCCNRRRQGANEDTGADLARMIEPQRRSAALRPREARLSWRCGAAPAR
jgi:hypothetical protein